MKILIVEDEQKIAEIIENRLLEEGYEVDIADDGIDGSLMAKSGSYDLIVLDIMLPYKDGLEILKETREEKLDTPIILLTAKGSLEDKLKGFKYGADDYLPKPFHMEELVARITRFTKPPKSYSLQFGDLELDCLKKTIKNLDSQEEILLSKKEYQILEYMLRNSTAVMQKEAIFNYVWGYDSTNTLNNLETYLSFIRNKLTMIESSVKIRALRGLGYKLEYK